MSGKPVIVFASFHPKPGMEAKVEQILRRMVGPTRSEPGNEVYDLYKTTGGSDDALSFHLFERYRNADALQAHRNTEHFKAYRAEIADFLAEPIGVLVLEPADAA